MANIVIRTIDDLEALVNGEYGTGAGNDYLNVTLANDLDFSELDDTDPRKWDFATGISSNIYMNFDGGEHVIKNLSYNNTTGNSTFSLFTRGNVTGEIKNLKVVDANIFALNIQFFGFNIGNVTNVHISGMFTCDLFRGMAYQGGIIDRCSLSGEVRAKSFEGVQRNASMVKRSYVAANVYITADSNTYAISSATSMNNSYFIGVIQPPSAIGKFFGGGNYENVKYNYVVILNAAEAESVGAKTTVWGTNCRSCFYNNDEYDYGNDTVNGTSRKNLQTASWLRKQGWSI